MMQDETTYRVTIEGVTWEQYRKILEICPLAEAQKESDVYAGA